MHSSTATAVALAFAMTILVAMAACDKSPTAPPPTSTGGAVNGQVQRLDLESPASIAPGATVQLRAFAVYVNGQRDEITTQATWRSFSAEVIDVDSSGRATGRREGEGGVQAAFGGRSSSRSVLVLPPDTWWVRGRVHDGGIGVANARVDVFAGTGTGKSATADALGNFKIFGVGGDVGFRASAEGFRATDVTRNVSANGTNLDFILQPAAPPRTLSGEWVLTFQAAADCSFLPDTARTRTYRASIEQSGASLAVTLSGAQFALNSNRPPTLENSFRGRVLGESLTLQLGETPDYYYYTPTSYDVAEQLGPNNVLAFVGTGTATATGSSFSSGSFSGTISVGPPSRVGRTPCMRQNHQFSLTR